jgi:ATP-binding cassette subfamily C (CFTR/MRP) protein 1
MFFLQKFYLRTSRQVRLLDIEAKAPLYLHFLETQKGASTIRAFHWQQAFGQKLELLLDQSMRPVYLRYCLQQWLSFVLSMLVTVLAIVLVTVVVVWRDDFDPASVGLSLFTVISFNTSLEELIRSWTILETSIGAVGRIKSFAQDTVPEETELDIVSPEAAPEHWPTKGGIDFTNVFAYYRYGPFHATSLCLAD